MENRIVYTLVDVVEGNCELKKALIRDKRVDGLYLLPTAQTRQKDCVSEEQMKNLSDELKKELQNYVKKQTLNSSSSTAPPASSRDSKTPPPAPPKPSW